MIYDCVTIPGLLNAIVAGINVRNISTICASKFWEFPVCLALFSAAVTITTSLSDSVFTRLLQKLATKEYDQWRHWCPDTHVTILSVMVITCFIQEVPLPHFLTACSRNSESFPATAADFLENFGEPNDVQCYRHEGSEDSVKKQPCYDIMHRLHPTQRRKS
ncbi:hypothetical protein PoB_001390900 [Plakobranchus ocellatus]|uniref:Uncharacterized protein n=1 Tax=Plakobranchus ocellatus TaxID=259542 RepID=A0AAV3YWG4_9GAST|nr:hypothetical protein PoB_001390900 [Plakobranchus ocellatus]